MLEQVYNNWGKKLKQINKDIKDLESIENTMHLLEIKLRDMGVEGFAKST